MATETDKPNTGVVVTLVVVGVFSMIAVSAVLTAMARSELRELHTESSSFADLHTVADLKGEQLENLREGYAWSDRAKGLVSIPLDRAMKLVVDDIARDPNLATPALPEEKKADAGVPEEQEQEPGAEEPEPGQTSEPDAPEEEAVPTTPKTPSPAPEGKAPTSPTPKKAPGGAAPTPPAGGAAPAPTSEPTAPKQPAPSGQPTPAGDKPSTPAPAPTLTPAKAPSE